MKINNFRIFCFLLCVLLFQSLSIFANNNKSEDTTKTSVTTLISGLKQGGLLVRLKTSENAIKTLIARGRTKEAEALKAKQYAQNLEVYRAFRDKYKFGNLYFFYSTHSNEVKTGQVAGIFLDSTLQADSSIKLNDKKFYVAEIGDIQSESTSSTMHGLRIMNSDLNEIDMERYFYLKSVWQVDLAKLKVRTPADMVEAFNKRLFKVAEKTPAAN
jgi:hypothetical protein